MIPQQPPQFGQPDTTMFRQRLAIVTFALISAQFLYLALAVWSREHGYKAMAHGLPNKTFIAVALIVGTSAAIISFPVAAAQTRRQPVPMDRASAMTAVQKQFFVGFALSEVASLAGLFIFFLFADLKPLLVLVFVASASIVSHYCRATKTLEDFERTPR